MNTQQRRLALVLWLVLLALVPGMDIQADSAAPLSFGVFPRWNAQITVRDFKPLAQVLGHALGREIRIETDKDFDAFMRRVLAREFDLVHLNQLQYLRAHQTAGYQALAKMCEDGECTIRAAIIVRADSGISRPADLGGRTIAFGDPGAVVSRVLVQAVLQQSGLRPGEYRVIFARNPPNALLAVYNAMADAAGVSPSVLHHPEITKRADTRRLRVIAESQPIPHLPIAVRGDLPTTVKQHILQALIMLAAQPDGGEALRRLGIDRFAPAGDAEYQAIRRLLDKEEGGGEGS